MERIAELAVPLDEIRNMVVADPVASVGSRLSHVMVGGEPIDRAATYGLVSNNDVYNGGDGYAMFRDAANVCDIGPDLADVTAEYLAKTGFTHPISTGMSS